MNVAKHDINCCKSRRLCSDQRWKQTQDCVNKLFSGPGGDWSQPELTLWTDQRLEHSEVAFNDNLLRWGQLGVSSSCVSAQEPWGVGANWSRSLPSSLQSHSHSPPCSSAWCHPTVPCTSNEPQRLCLPLPNYKLRTRLRARCHPLKLLNYGHWHQVWKLPLSPPRSRNRPCWITQAAQIKHSP